MYLQNMFFSKKNVCIIFQKRIYGKCINEELGHLQGTGNAHPWVELHQFWYVGLSRWASTHWGMNK